MADGALAANPPWLARIETPDGAVLGAGLLVDEDVVLTCAHVVDPPGAGAPTEVAVCFVHSDSARPVPGQVARSDYHPLASSDDSVDLAVIRLIGPRPPGTMPAPLAEAPSLAGQQLLLKGFPAGREWGDTVRALAVAEGGPRAGWWELHGESGATGTWVDPGFSGGPAWSETLEAVVAMTVARWPSATEREGYAIPLAAVVEAYPDLGLRVAVPLDDTRAEDRLRRNLAALVKRHGPTDARSISTRYGLAQLLALQGVALDEAERLLRQCLADTDAGGHPPRRKVGMWWALGEILLEETRYEEALACLGTAELLAEQANGPDDPRLATLLAAKGMVLTRLGRFAEAAQMLRRASALAGSAPAGDVARIRYAQAVLAMTTDMNRAERLAQECYTISRATFGPDHPALIRPAGLFGDILIRQQSLSRGRRLLEEAYSIAEARYPTNHPQVATCLGAIARLELMEGNAQAAFLSCSRALQKAVAAFGEGHPRTAPYIVQAAYARLAKGDASEALRLADQAVRVAERGESANLQELCEALYSRAEMRAGQNDLGEALADAKQALDIMVQLHGWGSMTAQPAALVSYLLVGNGRLEEGERLARATLVLVEGRGAILQPVVAGCRTTLAQVAVQRGNLLEAEEQYREVIRLLESQHGPDYPFVGVRYVELGAVQRRQLHFQDAERSIRRGLDILTRTLPPDHPSLIYARRLAGPATRIRRFMDRLGR
jgi:tetratricopeptide (TPR) repeat protein